MGKTREMLDLEREIRELRKTIASSYVSRLTKAKQSYRSAGKALYFLFGEDMLLNDKEIEAFVEAILGLPPITMHNIFKVMDKVNKRNKEVSGNE